MLTENEKITEEVGSLAARACTELFDAYGVRLESSNNRWGESNVRLLCGVIGFVGSRVRGTCLLAGSEPPLTESCPTQGKLRDWVGELANQLAGRLKTKFLDRGVEVALTTPIVLSGVRLEPLPRGRLKPRVFSARAGDVMVWVEMEATPDFKFGSEHPGRHGGEGDVLLF